MKLILGSGLIGLLARKILGPTWTIIPYGRSRFFSFTPALDDNFVIRDNRIDDFMATLGATPQHLYRVSCSVGGALLPPTAEIVDPWVTRVHGEDHPGHLVPLYSKRNVFSVYNIRLNELYSRLQKEFSEEIKAGIALGNLGDVNQESVTVGGKKYDNEGIISTIPLDALLKSIGYNAEGLNSKDCHIYHIATTDLDFEGANQIWSTEGYTFYKCNQIAPDRFVFYCDEDMTIPGAYFMQFMRRFDILDGTRIPNGIIQGSPPDLKFLKENHNIKCIGSYAEWDPAMDVATCLMRILTL